MKKLIAERIIRIEHDELSQKDQITLTVARNRQLRFLLKAYLPLALVVLYIFINGINVIERNKGPFRSMTIEDEKINDYNQVLPYVCGFFFLALTIFFFKYYTQTIAPLIRDLKKRKKDLLYIQVEKTDMAFFNKYYLTTPIAKKQQIQINKEDFYLITDQSELVLEMAPGSQAVLRLTSDGREITFY